MSNQTSSSWIPVTSAETKSAREMLKKALEDHGKDSSQNNATKCPDPTNAPANVHSQNIVDVLFKDFITKKIGPSTDTVTNIVNTDQKSSSKSNALNDLLDMEIKSIRSSTGSSSSKHCDKSKKVEVAEPVKSLSKSSSFVTIPTKGNNIGHLSSVDNQSISTSKEPTNETEGNNEKEMSRSENVPPPSKETTKDPGDKKQETFLSMLPLPLAKKSAKPKILLDLKLTKESVSLLKETATVEEGEEGEVFSSNSGESDKNDSLSDSDGLVPSEGGSLDSEGEGKKSLKHKKKHKHKKKKKKKKSKSKEKSKDEKKSDDFSERVSAGTDVVQTVINETLESKNEKEERDDRKRKSEKSNEVLEKKSKTDIKESSSKDDKDDGRRRDRKKHKKSRSKSRSRSPKKGKRSRSRSRSPKRSKRSKSRSPRRSKRSKSRSPRRSKRSKSRSPRRSKRSRSKSPKRSKSSRSRSPHKSKHSRSRSRSPRKDQKHDSSKSSTSRNGHDSDESKKSRSHQSDRSERKRSKERRDGDLRVKIDKAKLRKIAIANALQNMKTGQGPEVSINTRAGGKSVEELTDFCKKISEKEKNDSDVSESEEEPEEEQEEESLIHHPFKLRDNSTNIVLNIRNAKQLPVLNPAEKQAQQATLRLTFPVSSGSHHRATESEWVPVEPKPTSTALETFPAPATKKFQEKTESPAAPAATQSIFPNAEEAKNLDIGSIISERLQAVRKLQENPYDVQALSKMHHVQEKAKKWASSKQLPGHFSGSTGAHVMSQQEIIGDKRHQAWAKKTQLTQAAPVAGGIGMALLQKMGWKMGEGLGKNNEGQKLPLMLDVKVDRKGLKSSIEGKKGNAIPQPKAPRAKDLSNKHPVSALMELCNRRRWGAPDFTVVNESGPDHQKNFLFKVKVNNVEYQPAIASSNKKTAKAQCAAVCLQEMGLLPRDAPLNI